MSDLEQTECTRCRLRHDRTQVVVSDGGIRPCNVCVVGEAPGREEDEQGIPFVGMSGKILRYYCREFAGLKLGENAIVLNTVSCRPKKGNKDRKPEQDERDACLFWLRKNLIVIRPRFLLIVGKVAAETFLELPYIGQRGVLLDNSRIHINWRGMGFHAFHVYHPSYLRRQHSERANLLWARDLYRFGVAMKRSVNADL